MIVAVVVYIALGSNLGDRGAILDQAIRLLSVRVGRVTSVSSVIETEPVGFESEHSFLNQVVAVESELAPLDLLNVTQDIEQQLGRTHKSKDGVYQDRSCDIDIILYGDRIINDDSLSIPHPRFRERYFVLKPLSEIAPDVVDPVTGKTIETLLWDVLLL